MATGDCFSKTRNDMREVNNLLTLIQAQVRRSHRSKVNISLEDFFFYFWFSHSSYLLRYSYRFSTASFMAMVRASLQFCTDISVFSSFLVGCMMSRWAYPWGGIIPHDGNPFTIFHKLTFQLHHEPKDLSAFRLEHHTQGIVVIQQAAELDSLGTSYPSPSTSSG